MFRPGSLFKLPFIVLTEVLLLLGSLPFVAYSQAVSCRSVVLHTDRNIYNAGSSVWFKAYAYSKFAPDETSTVLLVELTDEKDLVVSSHLFPLIEGIASGNIDLGTQLEEGAYLLRAGIRNANGLVDSANTYYRSLYLLNAANPRKTVHGVVNTGTSNTLDIYPGSGKLVSGVPNEVFFKALDGQGYPLNISGKLVNANGDSILSFHTEWNGSGYFSFIPDGADRYSMMVYNGDGGISKTYLLEPSVPDRVTIGIAQNTASVVFELRVPKELRSGKKASVTGKIGGNTIFKKEILLNSDRYSAALPVKDLPPGLVDLAVTDTENKRLLGYRSFFVNLDKAMIDMNLHADQIDFNPGAQNILSLSVPDSIIANVSVSIVDHDRNIYLPQPELVSTMLLQNSYSMTADLLEPFSFTKDQRSRIAFIIGTAKVDEDALLKNLAVSEPACYDTDSGYLSVSGKVFAKKSGKPVIKGELKILFSGKDSGITVLLAPIDKNGSFHLKGLVYQGTGNFKYELDGSKEELLIKLDSTPLQRNAHTEIAKRADLVYRSVDRDTSVKNILRSIVPAVEKPFDGRILEEVKVYSNRERPLDKVNKRYTRGLFMTTDYAKTLDFINDPPPPNGMNIIDYLVGKVNGLYINPLSRQLTPLRWSSYSQNAGPLPAVRIYLNEQETSINFITLVHTKDVALVKYFPPGSARFPGIGMSGVLAVYTRKYDDYPDPVKPQASSFTLQGFDETKDFNAGEERITPGSALYWNPMILFDSTHRTFQIRFANSSNCRRFEVNIQGFSRDGRLISINKIIE